ncbi:MAG: hypothetical protein H0V17_11470 [Deltaproteobacteria bacterium]|nr:hypothetical protein [Deltaproteobacteria bacterium]
MAKTKAKPKAKAKPRAKSKQSDAAKGKKKPATSAELAALALAGDVEGLVVAIQPFAGDDGLNDALMYKWLEVASDFGPTAKHRKAADDLSSYLMQSSMLRYDDDQMATGEAHFELGVAYLTAGDGLPRDLTRAADQLEMAKERSYPWSIQGAEKLLAKTRKSLDSEARAAFDRVYDGTRPAPSNGDDDDDE